MTKPKKETSQLTIYEFIRSHTSGAKTALNPSPGSLDINKELKAAMSEDIRHAADATGRELSRYEIAGRMSELLGEDITKTTLDNWTAQSHPHEISAHHIPAFVQATSQRRAAEVIAKHSGLFLLPSPEALRAEIQQFREKETRAKNERRKRELYLKEIEK